MNGGARRLPAMRLSWELQRALLNSSRKCFRHCELGGNNVGRELNSIRERISRWGRTRLRHGLFSHQKWDPSWQFLRLADCTTATNDGLPETLPLLNVGDDTRWSDFSRPAKVTACQAKQSWT